MDGVAMSTEQQNSNFLHEAASGSVDVELHREVCNQLTSRNSAPPFKRHLKNVPAHKFQSRPDQLHTALKTLDGIGQAPKSQEANAAMLTMQQKGQQAGTKHTDSAEEELNSNDEEHKDGGSEKAPPHGHSEAGDWDAKLLSKTISSPATDHPGEAQHAEPAARNDGALTSASRPACTGHGPPVGVVPAQGIATEADVQLHQGAAASQGVATDCQEHGVLKAVLEAKRRAAEHVWRYHTEEADKCMDEGNWLDAQILALDWAREHHELI
ncbi:hypothetical protein WJX74_009595 [Apatococcus lobatus]|uniref:Uncharacterized protein n=2 Tax=Apatococcus TaxID=904362 RepID=A0AAW1RM09_9CHLO